MNLFSTQKVGGLPLFLFRIGFGIVALISSFSFLRRLIIHAPINQDIHHFPPLEWIALSTPYLIALPILMIIGSLGIISGYQFKFACLAFTLPYSYLFLLRLNNYNNHYYLIILLGLILTFTDAAKKISVSSHTQATSHIEKWQLQILKFQVLLPYMYSGFHKLLDSDWRSGNVLFKTMLEYNFFPTLISPLTLSMVTSNIGALVDLCISPLLIFKKTRPTATVLLIVFHVINKWILYSGISSLSNSIGVFPILGCVSIIIFWNEDQLVYGIKKIKKLLPKFFTESKVVPPPSTQIVQPYLASLILIAVAIVPLYFHLATPNFRWNNSLIGTWSEHSYKTNSLLDIYYQHNQTGQWILFHPTRPILAPQEKALLTPKGIIAVANYINSQMKLSGIFTPYIGIGYQRKFNNTHYKILDQIIRWEDLTPEMISSAINKTFYTQ